MAFLCSLLFFASVSGSLGQILIKNYSLSVGDGLASLIESTETKQYINASISNEYAAMGTNRRGASILERGSGESFSEDSNNRDTVDRLLGQTESTTNSDNTFAGTDKNREAKVYLGHTKVEHYAGQSTDDIPDHTENHNQKAVASAGQTKSKHKAGILLRRLDVSPENRKCHHILYNVFGHKGGNQSAGISSCDLKSDKRIDASSHHTEKKEPSALKPDPKKTTLKNVTEHFLSISQRLSTSFPIVKFDSDESTQNVHRVRRSFFSELPVYKVSTRVWYVTSPGFNDFELYPNNFDGHLFINISDTESVLVSFNQLHTPSSYGCLDYLTMTDMSTNTMWSTWKICGMPWASMAVYPYSLHLHFHTDGSVNNQGFKLTYAVLPRSEVPKRLPGNVFNCSVPHFQSFKPLLSCNALNECDGGEDEGDCWFHSDECGEDFDFQGRNCYRLVRGAYHTWHQAEANCIRQGHTLMTFDTIEEFRLLNNFLLSAKNINFLYLGAQMVKWQQPASIAMLYKFVFQWVNGQTAFLLKPDYSEFPPYCSVYKFWKPMTFVCNDDQDYDYFCGFPKHNRIVHMETGSNRGDNIIGDPGSVVWNVSVVHCPSGHVTRDFLSCDSQAECNTLDDLMLCTTILGKIPMFMCQQSQIFIDFSLVCDHMKHCLDNSDESFCQHPECLLGFSRDGKCINEHQLCDGKMDTYDGSDETCIEFDGNTETQYPPGAVYFDGKGGFRVEQLNSSECPPTHFLCPYHFCLPVYLRCNGILDCPDRKEEAGCESYTCPGFYRCRGSKVCLHADNVCDGVPQCPEQDDELLCDLSCPDQCHCQGLVFVCSTSFSASSYPALRYLDASGSGMTPDDFADNLYIIFLRLSGCGISSLPLNTTLPNLQQLDLSWNELTQLDMQLLSYLINLRVLVLTGNPLIQIVGFASSVQDVLKLQSLDISVTSLTFLNTSLFAIIPGIRILNISGSKITTITKEGFQLESRLETFDSSNSPLKYFPDNLLKELTALKYVYSNNYKLCCEATLPLNFNSRDCHTVQDLLASCEDLLRSSTHRVFLWVLLVFSICGNIGSFAIRLCMNTERGTLGGISMFITSLSLANFLTGVYLTFISVANLIYHGEYLRHDDAWKKSTTCKMAGFLFLLCTEVSVLTLCLLALDRFLVLLLPCNKLHFSQRSALVTCGVVWLVGVVLATVPLLPMTQHWELYSQTSICTPLPFTDSFQGYDYYFNIIILLNLMLSVLTALGQAAVSWSIRASSMSAVSENRSNDSTVARCLTTVIMSNLLCWFFVGLMGVLAATGTPIPGEIGVITAIFVLPFNSALNPFLYVFNVFMEKRKKAQEALLVERLRRLRKLNTNKVKARNSSRSHEDL